jgi:hypothetical protein
MSGFRLFMYCLARAALKRGLRGLAGLVPMGDVALDIASDAWEKFRLQKQGADLLAEVEALAQATPEEARRAAAEVVAQTAVDQPPAVRQNLTAYLAQVPAGIRQSLRRLSDPTGRTIPANLTLRRAEDLARFLPDRLPRFKPGERPLLACGSGRRPRRLTERGRDLSPSPIGGSLGRPARGGRSPGGGRT